MDGTMNSETIYIQNPLENTDNGNFFVIVPKNNNEDSNKQPTTTTTTTKNQQHQFLMPKSHLLQYVDNNTQLGQQLEQQYQQHQQQGSIRSNRDDKKRATHNEIERRRRDKISTWISQLGMLLPVSSHNKSESKGETLIKVCEYITEIQGQKKKLTDKCSEFKAIKESLRQLEEDVSAGLEENGYLKDDLLKCGFQLEQVTVPEGANNHSETTYLEFEDNNNSNNNSDNNNSDDNKQNDEGVDDDESHIRNHIDTFFQS